MPLPLCLPAGSLCSSRLVASSSSRTSCFHSTTPRPTRLSNLPYRMCSLAHSCLVPLVSSHVFPPRVSDSHSALSLLCSSVFLLSPPLFFPSRWLCFFFSSRPFRFSYFTHTSWLSSPPHHPFASLFAFRICPHAAFFLTTCTNNSKVAGAAGHVQGRGQAKGRAW